MILLSGCKFNQMKILKFPLGQLQANCYFLIEDDQCLIIDPADDASFILEELQRRRLKLVGMLATHGHFDHVMAVGEIQLSMSVPLLINKEDQFLIDRLGETAEYFLGYKQTILPIKKIEYINNKDLIKIGNFVFQIIPTPGHTPGSVCFFFKKEKVVFTGDTLFKGAIGRYDFSYCNKKDLKESLIKLSKLSLDIKVYPGHEEETSIKEEKDNLDHFINLLK